MNLRFLLIFVLALSGTFQAQKTLSLSDCEQLLQKNNLQLLAETYQISSAKAAVIQAKIWDLPVLSGELNAYNPNAKQVFNVGNTGQKAVAIEQLIQIGGKRKSEIAFEQSNVKLAELSFEQLLRSLRYELGNHFYAYYFNQENIQRLQAQSNQLDSLIEKYTAQVALKNIALKDVVRLQSLNLNIKNVIAGIRQEQLDHEAKIKLLIGDASSFQLTLANETSYYNQPFNQSIDRLMESAMTKNPTYLYVKYMIENSELNLIYQKKLAIPDLTVGAAYDQRGGAFQNQSNLTFKIPLPMWNRNAGNIKMAENKIYQEQLNEKELALSMRIDLQKGIDNLQFYQSSFQETQQQQSNFNEVYEGMLSNFTLRNISLMEFTDFMETYSQSFIFLNEIKKQILLNRLFIHYLSSENVN
ncbi:MAG: TolC family protein [Flavobacteriales bacterium]